MTDGQQLAPDWRPNLPLFAILRGIRPDEVLEHADALVAAGFDAIEIPLNSPQWQLSIRRVVERIGARASIGGGTVLSIEDVDILSALGARLVISPGTRPALIRHAIQRRMVAMPGIATPTEAFDALEAGAQALKIFPATTCGSGFVRALRAVLPPVPLYAVGGITPDNLGEFLAAGCEGAGLGSQLYQSGQDSARTASMARAYIEAYRTAVKGTR